MTEDKTDLPNNEAVTNLEGMTADHHWEMKANGIHSEAKDKGDSFLYSQSEGKNFVYSTDVTFKEAGGAAALIFRGLAKISLARETLPDFPSAIINIFLNLIMYANIRW